jgi:hypothetical protein
MTPTSWGMWVEGLQCYRIIMFEAWTSVLFEQVA